MKRCSEEFLRSVKNHKYGTKDKFNMDEFKKDLIHELGLDNHPEASRCFDEAQRNAIYGVTAIIPLFEELADFLLKQKV